MYLHKGQSVRVHPEKKSETVFLDDEDDIEDQTEIPQLEVTFKEPQEEDPSQEEGLFDPFNPMNVDYGGSEQSEGSPHSSPRGRYSGQISDEEELANHGPESEEYHPGAYPVSKEDLLVGQ